MRVQDLSHYDEDVLFGYGCSEISGIELSSDILINVGFAETLVTREGQYHRYELDVKGLNFMFEVYGTLKPEFYLCMVGVDLMYVHQLQNLFFALVGTELNITL